MLATPTFRPTLPGVYWPDEPLNPASALPRLDVAAFVGFAADGPLDTPVAVEDVVQFAAVFGGDLALARTPGGGTVFAQLPDAVRAFFANGGRRCYVVRVAVPDAALGDDGFVRAFLDPHVGQVSAARLLAEAQFRLYELGERLTGLHCLLNVDEVGLVACPDAAHPRWPRPDATDQAALVVTVTDAVTGEPLDAATVTIQPATGSAFTLTTGANGRAAAALDPGVFDLRALADGYRDAERTNVTLRPGETETVDVALTPLRDPSRFDDCDGNVAPEARPFPTPPAPPAAPLPVLADWDADADGARLLTLQRALVRFCAARGDVFAVLSLPRHFRRADVGEWLSDVAADPGFRDEPRLLRYAALYHPWPVLRSGLRDDEPPRACAPDGSVCGRIASRENRRGVWVAPANEPVADVVALAENLDDAAAAPLFAARANLLRQRPDGAFVVISAQTLSPEPEWRQISVRRLMILLRKLAEARGQSYVFEPNGEAFRSGVRRTLLRTLDDLFERGAFAGGVPELAYQVVADESLNPPQSVDTGRFVVEIKVAPSQPAEFLVVRLVRDEAGGTVRAGEAA